MFVVKNITKHDIDIPELRVTLSPGHTIDLDMISSRFYIEQARSLKSLFSSKLLVCLNKDSGSINMQPAAVLADQPQQKSSEDVINSIKQLEEKLTKRIDEKVSHSQPAVDVNALNQALAALQNLTAIVGGSQSQPQLQPQETKDVDQNKLVDIQKRMVNRLSGNTESKVVFHEFNTISFKTSKINF
jgi:hypothetical protein